MPEPNGLEGGSTPEVPTPVRKAVLTSGGIETRYHRAGHGAPVLLLADSPFPGASIDRLFEGLAGSFRVIRPEVPETQPGARADRSAPPVGSTWIRELIDGLGLVSCALVAEGRLSHPATWLAFSDTPRVSHLALLVADLLDPADSATSHSDLLAGSGRPVLLFRSDPDLERLVAFLRALPHTD